MRITNDQQRTVIVRGPLGLHMRVAQQIVQAALRFHATLTIRSGAILADSRSILSILVLGAVQGTALELNASGIDAAAAIQEIALLIDAKCDDPNRRPLFPNEDC